MFFFKSSAPFFNIILIVQDRETAFKNGKKIGLRARLTYIALKPRFIIHYFVILGKFSILSAFKGC